MALERGWESCPTLRERERGSFCRKEKGGRREYDAL